MQEVIPWTEHVGCEIVIKSENNAAANLNTDSSETTKSLTLYEKWALDYKNTFLSPEKFIPNKKKFDLSENLMKKEEMIEHLVKKEEITTSSSNNSDNNKKSEKRKKVTGKKISDPKNLKLKIKKGKIEIKNNAESVLKSKEKPKVNVNNDVKTQSSNNTCSKCNATFSSASNLKRHFKIVHKNKHRFECVECDFQCFHQYQLNKHMEIIHEKRKPFKCDLCSYESSFKGDLKRHVNSVHNNLKPVHCEHCDFRCSQKSVLKNHIDVVHKKLKPFSCTYCGHKSAQKAHLSFHINTVHKNVKPFNCSHCDNRFSSKYNLNVHLTSVRRKLIINANRINNTRIKYNKKIDSNTAVENNCNYCSFTCSRNKNLLKHIMKVHQTIQYSSD